MTKHKTPRLCLVSSSGGHWEQLQKLQPLIDKYDGFLVTEKTNFPANAKYFMMQTDLKDRFMFPKMIVNGVRAIGIWIKERPDFVITTGTMVAYPFYYETSILVYNKDYLDMWVRQQADRAALAAQGVTEEEDEAGDWSENCVGENGIPLTVEGLLKFANTFDAPEGVDGVMKWDVSDIFYNYWIVGNYLIVGGDCGDDDNNVNIYNDETVECLKTYQELNQFFFIEPDSVDSESAMQDFLEGKLVFTIGTSDVLQRLDKAKADGTFPYEFGIAKLPDVSETLKSRTLSVTNAVAINGFSEHKDLANRFAEFVTRAYSTELYPRSGKMAAALEASRGEKLLSIFTDQYANSVSLPKMMEIGNLWLQLEALLMKTWNGEEVLPLVRELEEQISTQIKAERS